MAATPVSGAESVGSFYRAYKNSTKVNIAGTLKVMASASDLGNFIVQNFYDGDTGQGQRADLIQAISVACGLWKGNI